MDVVFCNVDVVFSVRCKEKFPGCEDYSYLARPQGKIKVFLCVWMLCPRLCLGAACTPAISGGQERELDPTGVELTDSCELPSGYWVL